MKDEAWSVDRPFGEAGTYVQDNATTALVAQVYERGIPREEVMRRARLIAAAPALLAALVDACHALEVTPAFSAGDTRTHAALRAAAKRLARAAIHQATVAP